MSDWAAHIIIKGFNGINLADNWLYTNDSELSSNMAES